ncbi:unnamed protein product [Caenorhabditis bovis]|uniref:Uncharacterized protein n=1 Tax=Caenorhabditis bovis TaxID=2654633 RepID=A0A8S1FA59_9PELO|nr:unnamed protein product [Caenorhabditis bovis]
MPHIIELIGGPPWGFRVTSDSELRPIVGQLIPGGRGQSAGLKIGDMIVSIDNTEVGSCQQAHLSIQNATGIMKLHVERCPQRFHQTVRDEKLSSSARNSPNLGKKRVSTTSMPNSPVLPRTNPRSSPRQVRMDMMNGAKENTNSKRRLFEEMAENCSPTITDHLLKKKIQMGLQNGNLESSTSSSVGYDSAAADFAGRSLTNSSRDSPTSNSSSSQEAETTEDITVVEAAKGSEEGNMINGYNSNQLEFYNNLNSSSAAHNFQNAPDLPSSSSTTQSHNQWQIKTEPASNVMPADGDIEVPVRRNVAALRQVINDRLEMKTPVGGVSATRPKTPQDPTSWSQSKPQEPAQPSWAANVKVYEPNGFVDPHANKHNMGRVLDGPVNPNKYFQGVPPPSYSQVPTEAKPPAPPPKPAPPKTSSTIRLPPELSHNSYQQQYQPPKIRNPYEFGGDPRAGDELDDGASMISSCISTFGDSSEIAAINAAGVQRQLYDQYRKSLMNTPMDLDTQKHPTIPEEMTTSTAQERSEKEATPVAPSSSLFGADIQLTPFGQPNIEKSPRAGSMDLESSELLIKSKSPTPYSSKTADHFGTIRRKHTPVRLDPIALDSAKQSKQDVSSPPFSSPPAHVETRSYDSGYEGSNAMSPDQTANMLEKTLCDAFELASSLASSMNIPSMRDTESRADRPDSFMSSTSTTFDHHQTAAAPPVAQNNQNNINNIIIRETTPRPPSGVAPIGGAQQQQQPPELMDPDELMYPKRHFHSQTEPEMSLWYRKMFKQMHKPEPEDQQTSGEAHHRNIELEERREREQTPLTHNSRAQRVDVEITPRRARSVGRVVEPEQPKGAPVGEHLYALERAKTPHFHVPSYKFRDVDARPIRCTFDGCAPTTSDDPPTYGTPCMVCRRPRRDASFGEVDLIYKKMEADRKRAQERRLQKKIELQLITNKLDETTKELDVFINSLEKTWQRSKSQPVIRTNTPTESSSLAAEIDALKRLTEEDNAIRQKADRLGSELQKHSYVPSSAPSLHNNMDRFEGLVKDYSTDQNGSGYTGQSSRNPVVTATAVYKFEARSPRELPLNKGDIVRIIREVDSHWIEGERNGRSGIFPASYVQIESEFERNRQKMRAIYPFTSRNSNELSLKRGEIVIFRREIDMNWMEGSNQIGQIGIFPSSYVRMLSDAPSEQPAAIIPDRPKTPKIVVGGYEPEPAQNRVRFEEPRQQEAYRYEDSRQPDVYSGYASQQQPIDRLNEWENRKLDMWERPQQAIVQPIQQAPIAPSQSAISQMKPKPTNLDIRTNAASVIPKGSEMYRAIFDYRPQKEDELELFTNDIIFVVEKCDDGWFIGTSLRTGDFGIFPGNYVQRH